MKKLSWLVAVTLISLIFMTASGQTQPDFTQTEKTELLGYARECLTAQLAGNPSPPPPDCATRQQRACFVTFFNGRRVFACFGGFSPRRATLGEEISENVRLALKNDHRSRKIQLETARRSGVQITFPAQPVRVADYRSIDPVHEGMFVESGEKGVAFVPGEARTAAWAFREALRRLGVTDAASVQVYSFQATSLSARSLITQSAILMTW